MQASSRSSWLWLFFGTITWLTSWNAVARGDELPMVRDVEFQPLSAQVKRVVEALDMLGQPLGRDEKARLEQALDSTGREPAIRTIQEVLDQHCLIGIEINRREPGQGVAGAGRGPTGAERVVGLPGQGPQRGGRDGRAGRREPQRRPGLPSSRPAARSRSRRSARPESSSAGPTWPCSTTGRSSARSRD